MMKKLLVTIMSVAMIASMLIGCGTAGASTNTSAAEAAEDTTAAADTTAAENSDEPVEIYMFINGPEYADLINELIEEYKNVKPNVTINYETTQNDYPTMLKAKLNAGELPDIFASTAGKEIDLYKDYSLDLTGQPIAEAMLPTVVSSMADSTGNGCYGFQHQGAMYGIIYNLDCLEAAGVEAMPKTLSEMRECCEKLVAAGIQPFSCGYAEWWVFKQSLFPFMTQAVDNYGTFVNDMCAGKDSLANYEMMSQNMFDFVDLVLEYCDAKPLECDLATMETNIAMGTAAMGFGMGPWAENSLLAINPEMNIGIGGYPVSEDPAQCQVAIGADQSLHINKDSENVQACLDFINWWFTSEYGVNWLSTEGGVPTIDTNGVYASITCASGNEQAKVDGAGLVGTAHCSDAYWQAFGEAFQSYVEGTATREETIAKCDAECKAS